MIYFSLLVVFLNILSVIFHFYIYNHEKYKIFIIFSTYFAFHVKHMLTNWYLSKETVKLDRSVTDDPVSMQSKFNVVSTLSPYFPLLFKVQPCSHLKLSQRKHFTGWWDFRSYLKVCLNLLGSLLKYFFFLY